MRQTFLAIALAVLASTSSIGIAAAQECGPCASSKSVASCVACVKKTQPGKWNETQMRGWCSRNIPLCKKK